MGDLVATMLGAFLLYATLAATSATGGAIPPTVAIDMAPLDTATFDAIEAAGAYKSLVVRLVGEGFAIVGAVDSADFVVRFSGADHDSLLIEVREPARKLTLAARCALHLDSSDGVLQLVHATLALVHDAQAAPPVEEPSPRVEPVVPVAPATPTVVAVVEPPQERSRWSGDGSFGALPGSSTSLFAAADMRLRLGPVAVGLRGMFAQPLALDAAIGASELGGFVTVQGVLWQPSQRLSTRLEVDVGVWDQLARYHPAGQQIDTSRADAASIAQLGGDLAVGAGFAVGLDLGILTTFHDHTYRTASDVIWHTSHVRPLAGLRVSFSPEGKN